MKIHLDDETGIRLGRDYAGAPSAAGLRKLPENAAGKPSRSPGQVAVIKRQAMQWGLRLKGR